MACLPLSRSSTRVRDSRTGLPWRFFSHSSSTPRKSADLSPSPSSPQPQPRPPDVNKAPSEPSLDSCHGADCDLERKFAHFEEAKPAGLRVFKFEELRAATRNFARSHLLGEGGFGCVYKAELKRRDRNGVQIIQEVAVKQLNKKGQQGHKEWLSEVHFLGMVEHLNLVRLVGYCAEDDDRGIQRLLVYEFMPNKSLENHLFQKEFRVLSWEKRLDIMLGAARGLAYLHEEISGTQVIFRDFKSSNVLLDKDFTPKLSDFGLARQGPEIGESHVTTMVVGTWGYAAPEYIQTGHLTAKSDVWSFGVVLLEMLSGRRSLDRNRPKDEQRLLEWMKPCFKRHRKVESFVDPQLKGWYSLTQAQSILVLALNCLSKAAKTRPLMSEVVGTLKEIAGLANVEMSQWLCTPPSSPTKDQTKGEQTEESLSTKRSLSLKLVKRLSWKAGMESHMN